MARLNRSSLACIGWLVSLGTASTVGCGLETQGTVPSGTSSGSPTTGGAGGMGSGGEAGTGGMGGIPGTGGMAGTGGAAGAGDGGGGTGGAPMVCNPGVDTQPCYSGPVNTPNIGICKAGTQTCLADGTGFGTCEGEVIPGDENCVMPGDEDCDTFADLMDTQDCKCTEPGATVACDTGMMGVCAAGTGTCSATGRDVENCMPTKTASPENCATAEDDDCNGMAAPACSGDTKWVPTAMEVSNTTKDDSIFAVAPAGNGEYFIAGFVNGTLATDPLGVIGGGGSIYVAKLDAMGKRVWKNEYACTNYGTARGVGTDAAGNVYVAGEFSGTVKFDGNNDVVSASPSSDIFILKLDSTGKYVWHDRFGVNNHQVATDLAVNANGDLFITGYAINDAFSFGGMTYDPDGTDVFVAKFDKDKNHKWSRMFINTGTQRGRRLVLAPDGDVVIVGETDNNIDLGNGTISKGGNLDIIAAKYASADGAHKWSKLFGSTGDQVGRGIGLSSDGHILITGGFEGDITWKSMTTMTAIGTSDVYLAKLDVMNGNHLAHAQGGKSGTSTGTSIGADAAGNVTVFGYFTGAVDFGGQEITSTTGGANDLFLVKLNPTNLQPIWTKRYGKAGDQFGWDLTVASDGSNLLGGSFFTELEVPPMMPTASTGGADFVTILTNP